MNATEKEFGVARLEELLRTNAHLPAAELCRRVLETVDGFRSGGPQQDDMTLLIVRVPPGGRGGRSTGHD
jgi:serine phosphatase RsbU (regulator of sigma subunit)